MWIEDFSAWKRNTIKGQLSDNLKTLPAHVDISWCREMTFWISKSTQFNKGRNKKVSKKSQNRFLTKTFILTNTELPEFQATENWLDPCQSLFYNRAEPEFEILVSCIRIEIEPIPHWPRKHAVSRALLLHYQKFLLFQPSQRILRFQTTLFYIYLLLPVPRKIPPALDDAVSPRDGDFSVSLWFNKWQVPLTRIERWRGKRASGQDVRVEGERGWRVSRIETEDKSSSITI